MADELTVTVGNNRPFKLGVVLIEEPPSVAVTLVTENALPL